jgi:hypothetical protein
VKLVTAALIIAVTIAITTVAAALAWPPPAGAATGPLPLCGAAHVIQRANGTSIIARPNLFPTGRGPFCVNIRPGHPGFTVTSNLPSSSRVQAYPYSGYGCAFKLCSGPSLLPRQADRLPGRFSASWTWSGTTYGLWNASFDVWLDPRDQITRQDDGAEVMIWLRTPPGYHAPSQLIRIGGQLWWFAHWRTGHRSCDAFGRCQWFSWNYVQFRYPRTHHQVSVLRLVPLLQYAERRGLVRPWWWVTSVHAGFEVWSGGRGLATSWFWAGRA